MVREFSNPYPHCLLLLLLSTYCSVRQVRESSGLCGLCNERATLEPHKHRRRIQTEEKAKVVVSGCGEESIQLLAALTVLPKL